MEQEEPFLPVYTHEYYRRAARAYNMANYLGVKIKADVTVHRMAMMYWHEFTVSCGLHAVQEAVLAAACVFLAAKVEHYRPAAVHVAALAFDVDEKDAAAVEPWRRCLLDTELVLSDALGFNFPRNLAAVARLECLLTPRGTPTVRLGTAEREGAERVYRAAQRLFTFSFISPLCTRCSMADVVDTVAHTAAFYLGRARDYEFMWTAETPLPAERTRHAIMKVVLDTFAEMKKSTSIPDLDDVIKNRQPFV